MRKKTINHFADTIFWYVLYFLPIISYLLFCFTEPISFESVGTLNTVPFSTYLTTTFDFGITNFFYDVLLDLFGQNGVFNLALDNGIYLYFSWFIGVYLIHLVVDFILFIPRICHKWLKEFTQGD